MIILLNSIITVTSALEKQCVFCDIKNEFLNIMYEGYSMSKVPQMSYFQTPFGDRHVVPYVADLFHTLRTSIMKTRPGRDPHSL
jgi:hypothetical protein